MFAQIQKYTKNHWILYFKWVKFMVCDLYLNKAVIVKKINGIFVIMGLVFGMLLFFGAPIIAHVLNNEHLVTPLKYFALTPAFLLPTMGLDGIMAIEIDELKKIRRTLKKIMGVYLDADI